MPKDEFDFQDPFELNGMAFATAEDTTADMAECFIEEFLRLGYGPGQLLALFRNPYYLGPNMVYGKRGELFVRDLIAEVCARWGRPVVWEKAGPAAPDGPEQAPAAGQAPDPEPGPTDPMGASLPKLNL